MYILTALYIEDQLEELRDQAISIGDELGVKCPLKILPMHISLRKSFDIDDLRMKDCIDFICDYYSKIGPFSVEIDGFELDEGIIWLRMKENERLIKLHEDLVTLVKERYGVQPHELDKDFKFHSTVFMDREADLAPAFARIGQFALPSKILVRDFLIGTSESFKPEGYSIYKHRHLGPDNDVKEQWKEFETS